MATRKSKTFTVPARANKPAVPASAAESIGTVLVDLFRPLDGQPRRCGGRGDSPTVPEQRLATQKVGAQLASRRHAAQPAQGRRVRPRAAAMRRRPASRCAPHDADRHRQHRHRGRRLRQGRRRRRRRSGYNPGNGPLDRVRVDSSGQALTTNMGIAVADNQNSLKAGLRGPTLLEDFILREKITHFDHERIPERIVHARGSAAHGYFECYQALTPITRAAPFAAGRQAHAGVRALLDRRRRARLVRPGARRARLRRQVLHRRRQLGHRRQQHPGVLHPGRDEVPRPRPRGQARAAQRACRRRRARTTPSGTSSR